MENGVKMNKMKKMYILWGMIVVGLFTLLLIFGFSYKNKVAVYKDLEQKLVKAEMRYIDEKFLYPDEKQSLKTEASLLIEGGYLTNLEVNDEKCDGYAIISKNKTVFDYKAYIKCPKYKTKGYQD